MNKRIITLVIIIIAIIAFLFPKPAGKSGSGYQAIPPSSIVSWTDKECSCFGYKYDIDARLVDAPHRYNCIGIPFSCECIRHNLNIKTGEDNTKLVPCE